MGKGPQHEIANLKSAPGELSFDAKLGEATHRVWMRSETPVRANADAALAACLLPAMQLGGTLRMEDPVSPRILRNQLEFQAIQRAWSLDWDFAGALREVEVEAPSRVPGRPRKTGRVAAFFSGGVDSWGVILENPDVTDLVFVRGFDLAIGGSDEVLGGLVEERLRDAADELGLTFHAVSTNLRQMSDRHAIWDGYFGCAVSAVALFTGELFDRVLIAGDSDFEVQVNFGTNRLVDQLWSTEGLEIVDAGGRRSRMERVESIARTRRCGGRCACAGRTPVTPTTAGAASSAWRRWQPWRQSGIWARSRPSPRSSTYMPSRRPTCGPPCP